MASSPPNRSRWILPAPKAPTTIAFEFLQRTDVWIRFGICFAMAFALYLVYWGWAPPFEYRIRQAPLRNLHARTEFKYEDIVATEEAKNRARQKVLCLYENDPRPLEELRQALVDDLFELTQSEFEQVAESVWPKFALPPPVSVEAESREAEVDDKEEFAKFKTALARDERLEKIQEVINFAFLNIDKQGVLKNLEHEFGQGSMQEIRVFPKGNIDDAKIVAVAEVRTVEVIEQLRRNLKVEMAKISEVIPETEIVSQRLHSWFVKNLPVTLKWDEKASRKAGSLAAKQVEKQFKQYEPGDPLEKLNTTDAEYTIVAANVPLDVEDIKLLRAEHAAYVKDLDWKALVMRTLVFFGLFAAIFSLTSGYLFSRDRSLVTDVKQFATLIGLMFATLVMCRLMSLNPEWGGRLEVIPVVLFSMIIAIAYNIELSIILSALVSIAFTVAQNYGISEFVILTAASSSAALLCRTIRSRTKLFYIGIMSALVVFPTVIGVEYMLGQPLGPAILNDALWFGGSAALAGVFMTVLLPFFERLFDIQTDISLLELSDANHPLLRELVQRAPGTYNHSINVASISEAAAKAIGANGLLCRVGAYFHDVGKLRKPEYFIENQDGVNKHDDLVPSMSTLVIIAHVKDGAEIGRTHRLPKRIIDLIEQHHGTTLVEYFYRRAAKQIAEQDEDKQIDEADFRYPGPKPQSPEAAVMMLADAVESASRTLREPTPARIENLVRELAKKRLDDGQFDQCPITVEQLNTIQETLIKSLNAMYHSRVKYPDQQSA